MSNEKNLQKEVERLQKEVAALKKTNQALMNRVENSINNSGSSFSILESNILLQKKVEERTKELQSNSEKMEKLAREATIANKAKSDFLANMSHEIRTPMNAILGFLDLMQDKELDQEANDYIKLVNESGQSLLRIINDILDYSKIESGKFKITLIRFNIREEILKLINFFSPIAG